MKTVCCTGHRPDGLPWGYSSEGVEYDNYLKALTFRVLIRPCKEGDPNAVAFSRPASAKSYPISLHVAAAYNQAIKTMGWSTEKYYIVQGENYSKENAIVYDLKTAEEFETKQRNGKPDSEVSDDTSVTE